MIESPRPAFPHDAPAPLPADSRGASEKGFTLLEIMVALAILAVGSVCVLATFATAIALHMKREENVRLVRVMEEARNEAQAAWDLHRPTKDHAFPRPLKDIPYSRDPGLSFSITFGPVEGQPQGLDGTQSGVSALVKVMREGQKDRPREETIILTRTGFRMEEMKDSFTFEKEKQEHKTKDDKTK